MTSNIYLNNEYVILKTNLMRQFRVFNRNFTEDEIKQFLHNKNLQEKGPKKYVYNSYLYASEEEYKQEYERLNSGAYQLTDKSQVEITAQNVRKATVGEKIMQRPFKTNVLSRNTFNTKLMYNTSFNAKNIIE